MRIGIFGAISDPLTTHTRDLAQARGHEVMLIPFLEMTKSVATAFDGSSWMLAGERIESCAAFVVRSLPSPHSVPAAGGADGGMSLERWWHHSLAQQEIASYARSCVMAMEAMDKPVVNPCRHSSAFDHKPLQLAVFCQAGLPIPATLVANTPAPVRAFAQQHAAVIVKPVIGGATTRLLTQELLGKLAGFGGTPAIFQEQVMGRDIRVTVVAGRVVSSVEIANEAELDYRASQTYAEGKQEYLSHVLPREVEEICLHAAKLCGHVLSGIDLKLRPDGAYVLLEANSAPVYLQIEMKTQAPITDAVLDYLEQQVTS